MFPVGEAWLAARARDRSVPLYAFDGVHPSVEGSYLAALVMYATLYARTPVGLPARLRLRNGDFYEVSATAADVLQAAAAQVTAADRAQRSVPNVGGDQNPDVPCACAATSPAKNAELNTTRKVPVG